MDTPVDVRLPSCVSLQSGDCPRSICLSVRLWRVHPVPGVAPPPCPLLLSGTGSNDTLHVWEHVISPTHQVGPQELKRGACCRRCGTPGLREDLAGGGGEPQYSERTTLQEVGNLVLREDLPAGGGEPGLPAGGGAGQTAMHSGKK